MMQRPAAATRQLQRVRSGRWHKAGLSTIFFIPQDAHGRLGEAVPGQDQAGVNAERGEYEK